MKRSVSLSLTLSTGIEPPEAPGLPSQVKARSTPKMDGKVRHSWVVPEDAWPHLRQLRSWLHAVATGIGGAAVQEWCNAQREASDLDEASLVALAIPSVFNRPFTHAEPVSVVPCGTCGRRKHVLQHQKPLRVELGPHAPDVLSLGRHGLLAVSSAARQAIEDGNLADGVEFKPVETGRGEVYAMVVPATLKPIAAAPYGWADTPCPECRRGVAQHSFFPVFERPKPTPRWFTWPGSELLSPIVDHAIFSTLSSFAATAPEPAPLARISYGWSDTDARLAFLPEEFQGHET